MTKRRIITAADQFCGLGGFSQGLEWAVSQIEESTGQKIDLRLVAINHWDLAIATHRANHPGVEHICDELEKADPLTLFPDGRLRLLISSPECTHFSRALGGKPRNWQSRATSKYVIKWTSQLDVRDVVIENVADFRTWGPLYRKHQDPKMVGRPIESRKGQYFRAFLRKLEAQGFRVEHRILKCSDYGDPTTRERLFIRARKDGKPIKWPEIEFAPARKLRQLAAATGRPLRPYKVARDIIDWDDLGDSIFNRERPLADNTMRRIFAGLAKFSGLPFFVPQHNERDGQAPRTHSIDAPLPTVATQRNPILIQPFVLPPEGIYRGNQARSVDQPIQTITAGRGGGHLVQPFLFSMEHSTDASGHSRRVFSPDQPVPAVTARGAFGLAQSFVLNIRGGDDGYTRGHSVDDLIQAITAHNPMALVTPETFVFPVNHGKELRAYSVDEPMRTVTSVDAWGLATPFLIKYYGTGESQSVEDPLATVTGRDRFALCVPLTNGYAVLDIFFRMLRPRELARAHSLGHYVFSGSRENIVKQIGNSVPAATARALCYSALAPAAKKGGKK